MDTLDIFRHHVHVRLVLVGLLQMALLLGAVYVATLIRFSGQPVDELPFETATLFLRAFVFAAIVMLSMVAMGLYQRTLRDGRLGIVLRVGASFVLAGFLLSIVFYLLPYLYLGRGVMALAGGFAVIAMILTQLLFNGMVLRSDRFKRRILFYGAGDNAAALLSQLRRRSDQRLMELIGCVPASEEAVRVTRAAICEVEGPLLEYARRLKIDEIVVAMDDRRESFPLEDLLACRLAGIEITDMLTFCERQTGKVRIDLMKPSWLIFSRGFPQGFLEDALKRSTDLLAASLLLVLFSPVMLIAALCIFLEGKCREPILFQQTRVGRNARVFWVFKFRSMRVNAEEGLKPQWAVRNDPRVTRVGAFIRKYRIDELPQLLNVFKGEMSLVGPRPERPEFVEQLSRTIPYFQVRHEVKPGITGWAQLCYPYGASDKDAMQKLQFDLYYVKNKSFFLDFVILLGTAEVILFRKGSR